MKKEVNCIDHEESLIADHPLEYYATLDLEDFALGPAVAIYWYKHEHLKRLCQLENTSNIRIFPRFIIGDPLILSIDDLCWNHELAMDFQNITNRNNILYQTYSPALGRIKTVYQLGFIPVFQYKISF